MEFRSQEANRALVLAAVLAVAAAAMEPAREYRYEVRHDHWRSSAAGELVISERGVSYTETAKKAHAWKWRYEDIQQLRISAKEIRVLTYEDVPWKLGLDREQRFRASGGGFESAYEYLKDRLDQRLVAALADPAVEPLWRMPVKLKERFGGAEGELIAGARRIVFRSDREGKSRTWRYRDIDNISSSGPFELTVTTFERSLAYYGGRKAFTFQLKQALDEARYENLWRRLMEGENP